MRRAVAVPMVAAIACTSSDRSGAPTAAAASRPYLYVFAGDADNRAGESDFLAVIDADTASATYAQVLSTTPIGAAGTMPHHTEMQMPADGRSLFANSFMTGRTYLFDFANPLKPDWLICKLTEKGRDALASR